MTRFTIGTCRSGKNIFSDPEPQSLDSPADAFDAFCALTALAIKEVRRGNSDQAALLFDRAQIVERALADNGQLALQKTAIGATVSVDIVRHGQSLLRPEFKE
jgi:hypothetical protein